MRGDFLVFEALDDQPHNLNLLGGESIANARAHRVGFLMDRSPGFLLQMDVAGADRVHAGDKLAAGDVAKNDAVKSMAGVGMQGF